MTSVRGRAELSASTAAGAAAQTFVHLQFGVKAQTGQQHRGVAAFQQRQIAADEDDSLDRSAAGERGPTGLHRQGDGVLVVAGYTSVMTAPAGQVGSDRRDVRHGDLRDRPGRLEFDDAVPVQAELLQDLVGLLGESRGRTRLRCRDVELHRVGD